MNFTFTFTDEDTTVTKTFQADYLPELIDHFDSFVRGCGFVPKGEIQDVADEPQISSQSSIDSPYSFTVGEGLDVDESECGWWRKDPKWQEINQQYQCDT